MGLAVFSPHEIGEVRIEKTEQEDGDATTDRGMKRTALPMPVTPSPTSSRPAISVHMNRPSTPWTATIPETMTTKAPVGPPICTRDPPKAEMIAPATIAV
jgi:hypothetical protein